MKSHLIAGLAACLLACSAHARNTVLHVPLEDVLSMAEAQGKLDGSVKFYLAGQKTPKVAKRMDTDVSNPKTNGVGKSDEFGCRWAALTALMHFQDSARSRGANAVVDIVSYYKRHETRSDRTIECHAGAVVIGVALKGTYAKIER